MTRMRAMKGISKAELIEKSEGPSAEIRLESHWSDGRTTNGVTDVSFTMTVDFRLTANRHDENASQYRVLAAFVDDRLEMADVSNARYLALCMRDPRGKGNEHQVDGETYLVCIGVEALNSFSTLQRVPANKYRPCQMSQDGKHVKLPEAEILLRYIKDAESAGTVANVKVEDRRYFYGSQKIDELTAAVDVFRENLLRNAVKE